LTICESRIRLPPLLAAHFRAASTGKRRVQQLMRRLWTAAAVAVAYALVGSTAAVAAGQPGVAGESAQGIHVLPNPLAERQGALRENALKLQLQGRSPRTPRSRRSATR
jgi:hypothetical protein